MNTDYPYKIEKLQNNFDSILLLNNKIEHEKQLMANKLTKLKEMHTTMSKSNSKQIFLFCLDSFYFQYKTFAIELDNLNKFNMMIKNRIYCDYYKLYKLIIKYITENKEELQSIRTSQTELPVYKDLEPYYDYGIENIKMAHNMMLTNIKDMYNIVIEKEATISQYTSKTHAGYSISNFVNTLNHENHVLKAQIDLYLNYISFFHISQKKQIKRLYQNYNDFNKEIENNLNSDHAFSFDDLEANIFDAPELSQHENNFEIQQLDDIPQPTKNIVLDIELDNKSNELKPIDENNIPVFKSIDDASVASSLTR
tara:strand:+ start:1527 stop:2459 length:933 start_codon:yes stop_codon:yes gene_type:complete